jgi:hypothetical protein
MHNNIYEPRKVKTTYNLEWREYNVQSVKCNNENDLYNLEWREYNVQSVKCNNENGLYNLEWREYNVQSVKCNDENVHLNHSVSPHASFCFSCKRI